VWSVQALHDVLKYRMPVQVEEQFSYGGMDQLLPRG
jgi:hypothetical protein